MSSISVKKLQSTNAFLTEHIMEKLTNDNAKSLCLIGHIIA